MRRNLARERELRAASPVLCTWAEIAAVLRISIKKAKRLRAAGVLTVHKPPALPGCRGDNSPVTAHRDEVLREYYQWAASGAPVST